MSDKTFSSTEDIVNSASSWSLAKDVGLLHFLEKFSEDFIKNANETNENLNNLLTNLNQTHIELDIITNRFQSLHNTQFIESRVYEDDETLPPQDNTKKNENQSLSDEDKLKAMKNIILKGIDVVNKYYERVEIPGSDSDDENDLPRFTLRAKDPYSVRPLPYVIGTDKWHKKWHVGLLETSSESEEEKLSDKESFSDSEDNLPGFRPQGISASETSSQGFLHSGDVDGNSETFEDTDKNSSYPSQAPISNNTFAEQLAAKLGDVFDRNKNVEEPTVNTRPIQKVQKTNKYKGILPDEPPPLDNDDDLFNFGKSKTDDLFGDLDDDNTFWNSDSLKKTEPKKSGDKNSLESPNENNNLGTKKEKRSDNNTNEKFFDLFGDDNDELFNTNPVIENKKPILAKKLDPLPFVNEEPPEIVSKNFKKPVGGISVIKSNDFLSDKDLIISQKDKLIPVVPSKKEIEPRAEIPKEVEEKPPVDIFSEDSDLFDDDIFSNISTKKFTSNLFGKLSDEDDYPIQKDSTDKPEVKQKLFDSFLSNPPLPGKSSLFSNDEPKSEKVSNTLKPGLSLFDDVNDDFDDLFSDQVVHEETKSTVSEETNETNVTNSKPTISNDKNDPTLDEESQPPKKEVVSNPIGFEETSKAEDIPDKIESEILFSDDQIFESDKVSNSLFASDLTDDEHIKSESEPIRPKLDLFSSTPPELSDDWDVTSDTNPFDDMFDKLPAIRAPETRLFDDQPPDLFPNDPNEDLFAKEIFDQKPKVPEKPENYLKESKSSDILEKELGVSQEEPVIPEVVPEEENIILGQQKLPGKIKHSLNINVNALLPGSSSIPKKIVEVEVSTPKESKEDDGDKNESVNTLESVTKNRVRAPVQRRPSTRKGRKEHLRNTDSNFILNLPKDSNVQNENNSDDFEVDPGLENPPEKSSKDTNSLFDSSSSESELFSSKSSATKLKLTEEVLDVPKPSKKTEKSGLPTTKPQLPRSILDDEADDDLFKTPVFKKTKKEKTPRKPLDLFGDDADDEDDLFLSSSSTLSKSKQPMFSNIDEVLSGGGKSEAKNPQQTGTKKSVKTTPVVNDPLNLFGEN